MAENETGWTKEFPSLRYGSWFWLRDAPNAEPRLTQLCGGYNFYEPMGIVGPNTEYLGPISPSDFEQLTRLREAAEKAIAMIAALYDADAIPTLMQYQVDKAKAALRKGLTPQDEPLAQRHTAGEQS